MVHRISAFGYVLREPEQPLVLDAVKAKSLGAQSRELGLLKSGQDITLPNGDVIRSSEVTSPGRAARTIGIMQDTCDASSAIPYMSNCDLLVHESTFENSMREKAIQYGHSTSGMAADFAAKVNAKNLVLTHFSSRYGEKGENEKLRREAQEVLKAHRTRIFLAEDFMSFSGTDFTTISSVAQQP
jgi:ribonuclease Z